MWCLIVLIPDLYRLSHLGQIAPPGAIWIGLSLIGKAFLSGTWY